MRVPCRLRDCVCVVDEVGGRPERSGVYLQAREVVERDRHACQRAGVAGPSGMAGRERERRFVVPQFRGGAAREPEPADVVRAVELPHRQPQRRGGGRVAVGKQHRQPIEQTVGCARRRGRWRRASGRRDLRQAAMRAATAREDRRFERFQVRVTCESDVERLECLRGFEQQLRCVAFPASCKRQLRSQPLEPCAVQVVQRACAGQGHQFGSGGQRSCIELGVSGCECALRTPAGFGGEKRRAFEEGGRSRVPSAPLCPRRRTFETVGDITVRYENRVGRVPGASIRIGRRLGRIGERLVDTPTLVEGRVVIDRGAHVRVTKRDACAELEEPERLRLAGSTDLDAELGCGPPQQRWITFGLGCRDE